MNEISLTDNTEPSDNDRVSASQLALREIEQRQAVCDAIIALRKALNEWRQTCEVDLPETMRDRIHQSYFELSDGTPVKLLHTLNTGNITAADRIKKFEELGAHNTIKTVIELQMDRNYVYEARELFRELGRHRLANQFKDLTLKEFIPWNTATSFVSELIESGQQVDLGELGIQQRTFVQVGRRRMPRQPDKLGSWMTNFLDKAR